MAEDIKHIDQMLTEIVSRENRRLRFLRSTRPQSFHEFNRGDRISMVWFDMTIAAVGLIEQIEGTLVNPSLALVEVEHAPGSPDIQGKTIGLATDTYVDTILGRQKRIVHGGFAGNQDVAYCLAEDIKRQPDHRMRAPDDKIIYPQLKYGRVAVNNVDIIDFVSTSEF